MNVENMIYAYLAICFAMIVFNTVCIFVFRRREKRITKRSQHLEERVERQIEQMVDGGEPDEGHKNYLARHLRKAGNLLAFDETLDRLGQQKPEAVDAYLDAIYPVFVQLMMEYNRKDEVLVAFYLHILEKHHVLYGKPVGLIHEVVQTLIHSPGIYCRGNALQAVLSGGNADSVVTALAALDEGGHYYNSKIISDSLLTFPGDASSLDRRLWERLDRFSLPMQVAILNYFRFRSDEHRERMLALLTDETRDDEVRFSAIRYFGKYADPRVHPLLMNFADPALAARWEYTAVACAALGIYPGKHTVDLLKTNLHSSNWYIRFNAAQSLETIGFDYVDMADIFEGSDRFAREMLQYRMDKRREKQEAVL